MLRKVILVVALTVTTFGASESVSASALKPNWDIDYELYVGIEQTIFEIWVDPPNGTVYRATVEYTRRDANYRLFKMYEWNQIPPGSHAWIEESTRLNWVLFEECETRNEAENIADSFEAIGFPTMITPVFGGYYPNISSSMHDRGFYNNLARYFDP